MPDNRRTAKTPTMTPIRIAAAQSCAVAGDVARNVLDHARFIAAARRAEVELLLFPELSLCGYEPALLQHCALRPDDHRLAPIRELAHEARMTIIVGAPLARDDGTAPAIAAFIHTPDGDVAIQTKQHLHPGEEQYATAGAAATHLHDLHGEPYALAICADTAHPQHPATAAAAGASLYLASMLISEAGYPADAATLQRHAANHRMGVLMSNHGGPSGGYQCAGRSAFWAPDGSNIVTTPGPGNRLVVVKRCAAGTWTGDVLEVET